MRDFAEAKNIRSELLQRRIDATDRKIDELVYELYGLTDKEIHIERLRASKCQERLRASKCRALREITAACGARGYSGGSDRGVIALRDLVR
ncbi:MAG: hypothetical protein ABIF82_03840 [Planctomycetota bacterium]